MDSNIPGTSRTPYSLCYESKRAEELIVYTFSWLFFLPLFLSPERNWNRQFLPFECIWRLNPISVRLLLIHYHGLRMKEDRTVSKQTLTIRSPERFYNPGCSAKTVHVGVWGGWQLSTHKPFLGYRWANCWVELWWLKECTIQLSVPGTKLHFQSSLSALGLSMWDASVGIYMTTFIIAFHITIAISSRKSSFLCLSRQRTHWSHLFCSQTMMERCKQRPSLVAVIW